MIIVIVVALVVLVPVVLAAALYLMVSGLVGPAGPGGQARPVVVLSSGLQTSTGIDFRVTGAQPVVSYTNFRVNIGVNYAYGEAAALGRAGLATNILVGSDTYAVMWTNPSGSGALTSGDYFLIRFPSPPPPSGTVVTFVLIWTDGTSVTQATFTVQPSVSKPTVILTATKTATGADITVSITPSTNPSNFKVNIENVGNTTFGTAVALPTSAGVASSAITVGTNQLQVTWQNPSGNGVVSTGDHFIVKFTNGLPTTLQWSFLLIWSDGSTLTTTNWQT